MRRCLETDCRVVLKLSAMAFGVIACTAINAMIALLVGSDIAWKMSLLILLFFLRNHSVANIYATIWFRKFIFKKSVVRYELSELSFKFFEMQFTCGKNNLKRNFFAEGLCPRLSEAFYQPKTVNKVLLKIFMHRLPK